MRDSFTHQFVLGCEDAGMQMSEFIFKYLWLLNFLKTLLFSSTTTDRRDGSTKSNPQVNESLFTSSKTAYFN
jgi:hypothetical protein